MPRQGGTGARTGHGLRPNGPSFTCGRKAHRVSNAHLCEVEPGEIVLQVGIRLATKPNVDEDRFKVRLLKKALPCIVLAQALKLRGVGLGVLVRQQARRRVAGLQNHRSNGCQHSLLRRGGPQSWGGLPKAAWPGASAEPSEEGAFRISCGEFAIRTLSSSRDTRYEKRISSP